MARKPADAFKAKQKKQKIVLAVLGVVFLGLVAFQGPKLWKRLHPPATPVARRCCCIGASASRGR